LQSIAVLQQPAMGACAHVPLGSMHVSVVQRFVSAQLGGVPAVHAPPMQVDMPLHTSPSSHDVPFGENAFGGHVLVPVQVSAGSHAPVDARQVVPAGSTASAGHALLPSQSSARSHPPGMAARQMVPGDATTSEGQVSAPPHVSVTSQPPATAGRHTVAAGAGVCAGQLALPPVHDAPRSHGGEAAPHAVPAVAKRSVQAPVVPSQTSLTSQG
jgi:hypothetical protein